MQCKIDKDGNTINSKEIFEVFDSSILWFTLDYSKETRRNTV